MGFVPSERADVVAVCSSKSSSFDCRAFLAKTLSTQPGRATVADARAGTLRPRLAHSIAFPPLGRWPDREPPLPAVEMEGVIVEYPLRTAIQPWPFSRVLCLLQRRSIDRRGDMRPCLDREKPVTVVWREKGDKREDRMVVEILGLVSATMFLGTR